jgi:hypothetical protein
MRRTLWVLALLVVLLGALDFRPAVESHDGLGDSTDEETFAQPAKHPNVSAHFEQLKAGKRPVCLIRLRKLRKGGAHLPVAAHLLAPSVTGAGGLISAPPLHECCAAPSGARGPPAA